MDKESTKKLRLDTRLLRRRGWIDPDELARELESLPDAASKIADGDEEAASSPGAGEPVPTASAGPSPGAGPEAGSS